MIPPISFDLAYGRMLVHLYSLEAIWTDKIIGYLKRLLIIQSL